MGGGKGVQVKITKEFRDKLIAADHAFLACRDDCSLTFVKSLKVPGFGHATLQDPCTLETTDEEFPRFDSVYISHSILQTLFYTLREGDNLTVFAQKLEKDRKLYLVSAHINRNNKTGPMVLTFPLAVVRGK